VSAGEPEPTSTALAQVTPQATNVWEDRRLQKLWLATQRREWHSLAIVGADKGVDTLPLAEMLAHIAWAYRGQPSCVFDLRDLGLRLADYQAREIGAQVAAGVRVIVSLRSPAENPTAIAIARHADAVVLCVETGKTRLKVAERTIAELGRERVLGTIVLRKRSDKERDGE
jgi:hypothetical protein